MAFFDDFGKKISNLSQAAVQKTREFADGLNGAVYDEERNLNNIYREIGRIYVRETKEKISHCGVFEKYYIIKGSALYID